MPPRLEPLASPGHRSNQLPEVPAWVDHAKEPVDGGRHAGAVVSGTRSGRRRLERGPLGRHDSGRAQDSNPCKGSDDEADREEGRNVRQTIHLLVLSCAHGLKGLVVRESHAITTLGSTARRPRRAPMEPSRHRQYSPPLLGSTEGRLNSRGLCGPPDVTAGALDRASLRQSGRIWTAGVGRLGDRAAATALHDGDDDHRHGCQGRRREFRDRVEEVTP